MDLRRDGLQMTRYRIVLTNSWQDSFILSLSLEEKSSYIFLLNKAFKKVLELSDNSIYISFFVELET